MLAESRDSAKRFNMHSQSKPSKLDIKKSEPGIIFISLPIGLLFKLVIKKQLSSLLSIQRH